MKTFQAIKQLIVHYVVFSCSFHLQIFSCVAKPILQIETKPSKPGVSALIPFLTRFGYLEGNKNNNARSNSPIETDHEMLYTEASVEDAIREMQKYGGLTQTGRLDAETIALLTKPRYGLPDVVKSNSIGNRSKRYVIGSTGWNKRRITYRVDNWTPQLEESTVLSDVRKAFATWADYARLRFVNKPRGNLDDVDISISVGRGYHGDTYPFDGSGGVLAHAFFPNSHGSLGGDIHFDLDENWSSSYDSDNYINDNGYYSGTNVSFLSVAVHEIGHSLGLSHSPSTDSVMFPYYQGFANEVSGSVALGYDDIMAVYNLYIQREIQDFNDNDDDVYQTPSTPKIYLTDQTTVASSTTLMYDVTTQKTETSTQYTHDHETTERERESDVPSLCQDGFDTITFFRKEMFVFKDKYMWRFKEKGVTEHFYPVLIERLFPILVNVTKVDAAFENNEGQLVFVSGKDYWTFDGSEGAGPMPLSDFGLSVEKVNAAFIWGKNDKLYIFSENQFWRYSTSNMIIDDGYPKGIERWRGLPVTGIDSALTWSNGKTYFFKNDYFWRFNDMDVHTEEGFPLKVSTYWFGC